MSSCKFRVNVDMGNVVEFNDYNDAVKFISDNRDKYNWNSSDPEIIEISTQDYNAEIINKNNKEIFEAKKAAKKKYNVSNIIADLDSDHESNDTIGVGTVITTPIEISDGVKQYLAPDFIEENWISELYKSQFIEVYLNEWIPTSIAGSTETIKAKLKEQLFNKEDLINDDNAGSYFELGKNKIQELYNGAVLANANDNIPNIKEFIKNKIIDNFYTQLDGEFVHNLFYNIAKLKKTKTVLMSDAIKIFQYVNQRFNEEYSEYPEYLKTVATNYLYERLGIAIENGEVKSYGEYNEILDKVYDLWFNLLNKYGSDGHLRSTVKLFVETSLEANMSMPVNGKTKIHGKIDLLVVEGDRMDVYELKVSKSDTKDWHTSKTLTTRYQLGFYGRIINNLGINTNKVQYYVVPIVFNKNSDGTINMYWKDEENWTDNIDGINSGDIQKNLDMYIPRTKFSVYSDPEEISNVRESLKIILPYEYLSKNDFEYIKERIAVKNNDTWEITYPNIGNDANRKFSFATESELDSFIPTYIQYLKENGNKNIKWISSMIDRVIGGDKPESLASKDETKKQLFYNILFSKYYTKPSGSNNSSTRFQIIENDQLFDLGIIGVIDNVDHSVDFFIVEDLDLDSTVYYSDKRKMTHLFESFIDKKADPHIARWIESEYARKGLTEFEPTRGNVAILKGCVALNELSFLKGLKIGEIRAINSYRGQSKSFSNDEIAFIETILNKFGKNHKGQPFDKNLTIIQNGPNTGDKRLSEPDEVVSKRIIGLLNLTDFDKGILNEIHGKNLTILYALQEPNHNRAKALFELAETIANEGKVNKVKPDVNNAYGLLYSYVNQLALYYNNINVYEEMSPAATWGPTLLTALDSLLINSLDTIPAKNVVQFRNLVTTATSLTKEEFTEWVQTSRKKNQKYEEDIQYSKFRDKLIGDKGSIHTRLFVEGDEDLVLKNPYDINNDLSPAEREYAKWILSTWTKHKGSEVTREDLLVPLMRARVASQISTGTFFSLDQIWEGTKYKVNSFIKDTFEERKTVQESAADSFDKIVFEFEDRTNIAKRRDLINKYGAAAFETNLELISSIYKFSEIKTKNYNTILPNILALQSVLALKGALTGQDVNKLMDFIFESSKNIIYNESLVPKEFRTVFKYIETFKTIASVTALSWNVSNLPREIMMGFWVNIESAMIKRYGLQSFGVKDYSEALKYLFYDAPKFISEVTKIELLNEIYAMANMDVSSMAKNTASYKNGIVGGFSRYSGWWLVAPDYWNRMSIFLAQMIHDGCWKAHYMEKDKDGVERLVYDCTKDQRFDVYFKYKDHSIPKNMEAKYNKQYGLYVATLNQFNDENKLAGKPLLKVGDKFPRAYTVKQRESIKSFADMSFGYYDLETRSQWNRTWQAAVLKQFMTYLTAKKTQYMLKRTTIPAQGSFVEVKDENGDQVYVKIIVDKNGYFVDSELVKDDTGIPLHCWQGRVMEGIFQTWAQVFKDLKTTVESTFTSDSNVDIKGLWSKYLSSNTIESQNIKASLYEITVHSLLAKLLLFIIFDEPEDRESYNKALKELDWVTRNGFDLFTRSVDDIGAINAIQSGLFNWTPPSFSILRNVIMSYSNAFRLEDYNLAESFLMGTTNAFGLFRPIREEVKNALNS